MKDRRRPLAGQAVVDRFDASGDHDAYTPAGALWRLFDAAHHDRITARIAESPALARPDGVAAD